MLIKKLARMPVLPVRLCFIINLNISCAFVAKQNTPAFF